MSSPTPFVLPVAPTPASRLGRLFNIFFFLAILTGVLSGVLVVVFGNPAYIFVGLIAIIVFAGAIFSVQFGLLAMVFIIYTRLSDVAIHSHNAPSVAKGFIALLVLAIFVRWAIFRETPTGWTKMGLLLGFYGLIGFSSMLYAANAARVMDALVYFAKDAVIAVVVVVLLQTGTSFRRVVWVLIFVGIFLGTLSSYQYLMGDFTNNFWGFANARVMQILGQTNDYRIGGPIGDPNFFAQIMVVITPLALERFIHEPRMIRRLIALWSLVVVVLSIMFTYSRGGFLALAVTILLYFIVYPPRSYQMPIFILSILLLFSFAPKNYFDRILSLDQFFGSTSSLRVQDDALRSRVTENLTAWEMVKSNPLLGVGLSNYSVVFAEYSKSLGVTIPDHEVAAHDLYLEVLAETGILGLSIFGLMIFLSLRAAFIARREFMRAHLSDYAGLVSSFAMGLIGYLVAATFVHGAYPRYFYLLIGICMSLEHVYKQVLEVHTKPAKGTRR
jgi:putative inorganic carbon (hco3(-)) transporter